MVFRRDVDFRKHIAVVERTISDDFSGCRIVGVQGFFQSGYVFRNSDGFKYRAVHKRSVADEYQTLGKSDVFQHRAVHKCACAELERVGAVFCKRFSRVFKLDRGQLFAGSERRVADTGYGGRNYDGRNCRVVEHVTADGFYSSFSFDRAGDDVFAFDTAREVYYFDFGVFAQSLTEQNAVLSKVALVVFVNVDFLQSGASEHVSEVVDLGSILTDVDGSDIADRLGRVGGVERIFRVIDYGTSNVYVENLQLRGAAERVYLQYLEVFGQGQRFDLVDAVERRFVDGHIEVVGFSFEYKLENAVATVERVLTDVGYISGDSQLGDVSAGLERRFGYRGDSLRNGVFACSSFREVNDGVYDAGYFVLLA